MRTNVFMKVSVYHTRLLLNV